MRIDAATRRFAELAAAGQNAGMTPIRNAMAQGAGTQAPGAVSFGDTLKRALEQVSETQDNSAVLTQAFLRGEQVELHQVMAAAEEAGIAVEMLVEIRNKFTEAYRTVINMQS
jgi:flagellar hook-basal body complex protein FliE